MSVLSAFRPHELAVAIMSAIGAQLSFAALFLAPPPPPAEAEMSDDNARPIAIAITPVALLKKGSPNPGKLPTSWERKPPAAKTDVAQPSTQADLENPSKTKLDAGAHASTTDAGAQGPTSATSDGGPVGDAGPTSASSGVANGAASGTETDPLKGRAADLYRAQLASWFLAHFMIKGKVPFEELQKLRGEVLVSIGDDRHVGGHSVTRQSGNAVFDAEVEATINRIRASGAEVPAPPPNYPEMLGKIVTVGFRCTNRSQCE